jgi:hypothetical protein
MIRNLNPTLPSNFPSFVTVSRFPSSMSRTHFLLIFNSCVEVGLNYVVTNNTTISYIILFLPISSNVEIFCLQSIFMQVTVIFEVT